MKYKHNLTTWQVLVAFYDSAVAYLDYRVFLVKEGFWSIKQAFRRYTWLMMYTNGDENLIDSYKKHFYYYLNNK